MTSPPRHGSRPPGRELTRLVGHHRVLTTDQLAALAFTNLTTARTAHG